MQRGNLIWLAHHPELNESVQCDQVHRAITTSARRVTVNFNQSSTSEVPARSLNVRSPREVASQPPADPISPVSHAWHSAKPSKNQQNPLRPSKAHVKPNKTWNNAGNPRINPAKLAKTQRNLTVDRHFSNWRSIISNKIFLKTTMI